MPDAVFEERRKKDKTTGASCRCRSPSAEGLLPARKAIRAGIGFGRQSGAALRDTACILCFRRDALTDVVWESILCL